MPTAHEIDAMNARLLSAAVGRSGKSQCEIARTAGLGRDSLRRTLLGQRTPSPGEVFAIIEATGFAAAEILYLSIRGGEELALTWMGRDATEFLGHLYGKIPIELDEQLGDDLDELRPRWANGTAKLIGRTLSQHVSEVTRRGDSIGDQRVRPEN